MEIDLQTMNERFSIPGHVQVAAGMGGLMTAVIENEHASATITAAGGHVMTYQPRSAAHPVLWVSPNSYAVVGKAMRGGVPVCWPWFGPHPSEPQEKPMHGVARTQLWQLAGTCALPDGATEVRMVLRDNEATRALWPCAFELEIIATVGPRLTVEWVAHNPGEEPFTYTGALHPYFAVSDIRRVQVHGLDGVDYLDKPQNYQRFHQQGPVTFDGMVDRVYLNTTAEMAIEDPGFGRTIHIAKTGSHTSVVWNPSTGDAKMPDVGEGQHKSFVCVEAANAMEDVITVPPGGEGRLGMEVWCV